MVKKLLFPLLFCLTLALPAHANPARLTYPAPVKGNISAPQGPKEHVIVIRTAKDPKVTQVKVGEKGEILIPQSTVIAGAAVAGAAVAAATPAPPPAETSDDAKKSEDKGFKSASGTSGSGDSKTSDLSSGSSGLFGGSDSGLLGGGTPTGFATIPDQTPVPPTPVFTSSFTIFATAGDRGTISPSGTVMVAEGNSVTFTITPNANFHVDDVTVDSVSQGAITSFTFSNVTTSHTITASFTTPTQELQTLLNQTVSDDGIPGAILAVQTPAVQTDTGTWIGAAGKADLGDVTGTPQDMTGDTQVRLAGVSRLLTAALVMKLVEEGSFTLGDKVDNLLIPLGLYPGDIPSGDKITVSMLLNHTSGLHDHETTQEFFNSFISLPAEPWDPIVHILPLITGGTPEFAPGTDFKYSSTDYYVLGLLAGWVAGIIGDLDPLQQLQADFFSALNLSNTTLTISGLFDPANNPLFARTYSWPGVPEFPTLTDTTDWDLSFDWTNGSGISTAQDMLTFTQALFVDKTVFSFPDDPNKVQYDAFLKQMTTPDPNGPTNAQGQHLPYGYGLEVVNPDPWFGEKAYKSDGDTTGAYARWLYYPASGRTIFIAFNRADKRFNTDPPDPALSPPQVDAAKKADDLLKAVSNVLKAVK